MGGGWFNRELKIFILFLGLISFSNLIFSNNTFASYTPTLSASVDQTNLQVNGNSVINSTNKTTEIPLNLTVNTNNKTGYTATLSSETENTALTNTTSTAGAKINSISSTGPLGGFSNNTWGYKFGASTNYAPIPALSAPAQILKTTGKTNGNESSQLSIGMKLTDNLESGNYTNKLILSFVSNPYTPIAIMTEGPDFNAKLKALETATNKIEHFKKSSTPPATTTNAKNIEDEESDYEIKLWLDPTDKTAYYYAEPEKAYLNADSSQMFRASLFKGRYRPYIKSLDLSSFNTSKVTDMHDMFFGMSDLTTLDLSNFDTSNVMDMSSMFSNLYDLAMLNLSSFDTSKVTDMHDMFSSTSYRLTTLDLSSFDTSKVTNMAGMFKWIYALTTLDLSHFDTSNVTNMREMFKSMSNLTALNLSNFNTSKVTDMRDMFFNMPRLTTLDLSNFDTSKVTDMNSMFAIFADSPDDKLEKIYVNNDFDTTKLTSFGGVFSDRKKLRGGNGSYLANPTAADKTWLRIDDPVHGRPGYFTRKP